MTDEPYFRDWNDIVGYFRANMEHDADNVVAVDGYEGSGKSTFALRLAQAIQPSMDPATQIIFDWDDWRYAWRNRRPRNVYIADEAFNLLFNRDWNRYENKALIKLLAQIRQLNCTIILCGPSLFSMDKNVREHRASARFYTYRIGFERGHCGLQWRRRSLLTGQTWWEDLMVDLRFDPYGRDDPMYRGYLRKKKAKLERFERGLQDDTRRPARRSPRPNAATEDSDPAAED